MSLEFTTNIVEGKRRHWICNAARINRHNHQISTKIVGFNIISKSFSNIQFSKYKVWSSSTFSLQHKSLKCISDTRPPRNTKSYTSSCMHYTLNGLWGSSIRVIPHSTGNTMTPFYIPVNMGLPVPWSSAADLEVTISGTAPYQRNCT